MRKLHKTSILSQKATFRGSEARKILPHHITFLLKRIPKKKKDFFQFSQKKNKKSHSNRGDDRNIQCIMMPIKFLCCENQSQSA